MKEYILYVHINKINGKKYVGITKRTVKERWRNNGKGYDTGHFKNAITKYGWNNFEHQIIADNLTEKEAKSLEVLYIGMWNTNDERYGYNLTVGGDGSLGLKHTEEAKKKCGLSQKGGKSVRAKKVVCDGIIFECITDCANYYNIPKETITSWLKGRSGAPQEFIDKKLRYANQERCLLKTQIRPSDRTVVCAGVVFNTVKECAGYYGIPTGRMTAWVNGNAAMPKKFIELGLTYSDKINEEVKVQTGVANYHIICDGVIYNSVNECAKAYGISGSRMGSWLLGKRGMPQEFFDRGLRYLEGHNKTKSQKRPKKKVVCEGNTFDTIVECANYYNTIPKSMGSWLSGSRKMPAEFIDKGLRFEGDNRSYEVRQGNKKKVVCEGKVFATTSECAKFYNINLPTMSTWLNGKRAMPQRFKNMGLKYYITK